MEKLFLAVGNAEIALSCAMSQIPLAGETRVESEGRELTASGDGLITAAVFAALGKQVRLCCAIGHDRYGELLRRFCRAQGIGDEAFSMFDGEETAFRLRLLESTGVVRTVFYPGAFRALRAPYIGDAFVCRPDAVTASLELAPEAIAAVADACDEQDVPLFLDAAHASLGYPTEHLGKVKLFTIGAAEAAHLTQIDPDSMDSALKCAVKLAARIPAEYYAIRLRERGVFLYDGKFFSLTPPQSASDFASPVAAQVFLAAAAEAFVRTREMESACREAAIAVAVAAKREGADVECVPRAAEIAAFRERYHLL